MIIMMVQAVGAPQKTIQKRCCKKSKQNPSNFNERIGGSMQKMRPPGPHNEKNCRIPETIPKLTENRPKTVDFAGFLKGGQAAYEAKWHIECPKPARIRENHRFFETLGCQCFVGVVFQSQHFRNS